MALTRQWQDTELIWHSTGTWTLEYGKVRSKGRDYVPLQQNSVSNADIKKLPFTVIKETVLENRIQIELVELGDPN